MSENISNEDKMKELENLENQAKNPEQQKQQPEPEPVKISLVSPDTEKTIIDGYRVLDKSDMPFSGEFYPESWSFAYRCPTTEEVANFSTIADNDNQGMVNAVESLIKKCFTIFDVDSDREISSSEINDGERLYFFLLLRDFYMGDVPIKYVVMNTAYNELVEINLIAKLLKYPTPKEVLLTYFDGRKFSIPVPQSTEIISFLMPTLNTSSRLFRYIINSYQASQKDNDNKSNKEKIADFDKQFLLFAPFLYETGNEKVADLKQKFIKIKKDDKLFKIYLNLVNTWNLTNFDYITYEYRGSEEDALMKFPGGWKSMFINKEIFAELF